MAETWSAGSTPGKRGASSQSHPCCLKGRGSLQLPARTGSPPVQTGRSAGQDRLFSRMTSSTVFTFLLTTYRKAPEGDRLYHCSFDTGNTTGGLLSSKFPGEIETS